MTVLLGKSLEKYSSLICFTVKKFYAMEAIPTQELISYTGIKWFTNGFDLCTPKKWCSSYVSVGYIYVMWCQECIFYYWINV